MMRFVFLLFGLLFAPGLRAETSVIQVRPAIQVQLTYKPESLAHKSFKSGLFPPRKRHKDMDKLAIVAISLDGLTLVLTLLSYFIWGGFAAGFVLAFSSIFTLAGMILGAISLIRAIFRGWRRGTIWAAIALGIPLLFLLIVGLLS